jgi:hypothetical protein
MFTKIRNIAGRSYLIPTIGCCWLITVATGTVAQGGAPVATPSDNPLAWAQTVGFGGMLAWVLWMNNQSQVRADAANTAMREAVEANTAVVRQADTNTAAMRIAVENNTTVVRELVTELKVANQHERRAVEREGY